MRDNSAKHLSTLHRVLYRLTGGVIGRRLVDNDMLLLTTTGRRSGTKHTVPLLYLYDGDDIFVIASWGGRDNHPEWYLNLKADPRATVQIERKRFAVTAETAEPQRRERLWQQVLAAYDGYRIYESRTDRRIPLVILKR